MLGEPLLVVSLVVRVLEDLGVRYVVGGSVASSIYGEPRATQDVDIVAELQDEHVDGFIAGLAGGFYAAAHEMDIAHGSSIETVPPWVGPETN